MLSALAAPAQTQRPADRDFGLGLIIGSPTGASLKGFLSEDTAIDGAIGFGLIGHDNLRLHADFLWQFEIKSWPAGTLDLHLGVGPELGIHGRGRRGPDRDDNDHIHIGARAPFGASMMFTEAPFDVFVEVAAGLWIVEHVDFHIDGAIGGRYWF